VELRCAALASLLVIALLGPCPAAGSGPGHELREFVTGANAILIAGEDRDLEELVTAIVALARPMVAFREAAESALGGDWRARTPTERDEFTRMFAALLERALVLRLAGAAKIGRGVEMVFGDESITGDVASVRATAIGKDGHDIPLAYRLIRRGPGWAVRDVAIDGVSVIDNYRAQFSKIIREASYPELIGRLRDKMGNTSAPSLGADSGSAPMIDAAPLTASIADGNDVVPVEAAEPRRDIDGVEAQGIVAATAKPSEPSPLASPAEAVPTVAPSGARYWVQVGAFRDVQTATRLAGRLLGDHWSVGIVPGQSLTRVRVGPFTERTEAVSTLRALTLRGFRPFVHEDPSL
jgi:ABC-type transporter MlaC component